MAARELGITMSLAQVRVGYKELLGKDLRDDQPYQDALEEIVGAVGFAAAWAWLATVDRSGEPLKEGGKDAGN